MSFEYIDGMPVLEFFEIVALYDKMTNPEDYVPAETFFRL